MHCKLLMPLNRSQLLARQLATNEPVKKIGSDLSYGTEWLRVSVRYR